MAAATKKSKVVLSWTLYITLLLIRIVISPFFPGYVHPDEFFQGGQELWFGHPPTIPWEFERENALRSVVPPTILSLLPLRFYSLLLIGRNHLSGREILIVPRIWCAILSFLAMDLPMWAITTDNNNNKKKAEKRKPVPTTVLILASSWPVILLSSRPFSNALEASFLSLLLYNVLDIGQRRISNMKCLWIGILCALGVFTRFTFIFFAFPIMLHLVYSIYKTNGSQVVMQKVFLVSFVFFTVSLSIIFLDTNFYRPYPYKEDICVWEYLSSLVITPWNALSYNSKVSNLKNHGLHPRWTHTIVNMFLLYGPLTAIAYIAILTGFISRARCSNGGGKSIGIRATLSKQIILSGLGLLSLAPHQEPRFLLPLIVPIALVASDNLTAKKVFLKTNYVATVWIIFNITLLTLFGILHQSGVVKSLLRVGSTLLDKQPASVIYFHTYMPPTFLLQQQQQEREELLCQTTTPSFESDNPNVCEYDHDSQFGSGVVDLKGSNLQTLKEMIEAQLSCSTKETNNSEQQQYLYLVTPPLQQEYINDKLWSLSDRCTIPNHDCDLLWQHSNHLSTEDLPRLDGSMLDFYNAMVLNVFNITCASSPDKES